MDTIVLHQVLILIFQCLLVAGLLLLFFRLRTIFGLGLFYIAIGLFKFMHYFYTQAFAFEILPGINISIGSTVMYTGDSFCYSVDIYKRRCFRSQKNYLCFNGLQYFLSRAFICYQDWELVKQDL